MTLHDAIRNATNEHTVYFLLTAYVDTLQFGKALPDALTALPIRSLEDVQSRLEKLVTEFEAELRTLDQHKSFVVLESIEIFDMAAVRLRRLIDARDDGAGDRARFADHEAASDAY